jgi:hypothetical protein
MPVMLLLVEAPEFLVPVEGANLAPIQWDAVAVGAPPAGECRQPCSGPRSRTVLRALAGGRVFGSRVASQESLVVHFLEHLLQLRAVGQRERLVIFCHTSGNLHQTLIRIYPTSIGWLPPHRIASHVR